MNPLINHISAGPMQSLSLRPVDDNQVKYETLEKAVLQNNPQADRVLLKKAFAFAQKVHAHQKRDEGVPYFVHP